MLAQNTRLVPRTRAGRSMVGSGALLLAVSAVAMLGGPQAAVASSHREAPLIAGNPKADNTDTYAFVSPDAPNMVNFVANWIPFEEPNGGPNFYPWEDGAHYDIHVDNDGDGVPDVTYQWTFTSHVRDTTGPGFPLTDTFLYNTGVVNNITDTTLNYYQTYNVDLITAAKGAVPASDTTIVTGAMAAPSDTGLASMPNYANLRTQATVQLPGGGQTVSAQADDSFFLDLRVFDLLYGAPNLSEAGHDTLAGYNVNSIALQVPMTAVALAGTPGTAAAPINPVIGTWATTEEQTTDLATNTKSGNFVQVSRLGNPLVNELVVPRSLKDAFNSIPPSADHTVAAVVANVIKPTVPKLINLLYGLPGPTYDPTADAGNRQDIFEIFLTGIAKAATDSTGAPAPIQADLNSQLLNKGVQAETAGGGKSTFTPAEELRLNMLVPPVQQGGAGYSANGVIGNDFAGFPNGRRLTDDVVDIELLALEGADTAQADPKTAKALGGGDGVSVNDSAFSTTFPYIALPHTASVNLAGQAPAAPAPPAAAPSSAAASSQAPAAGTGTGAVSGTSTNTLPVGAVAAGAGGLTSTTSSSTSVTSPVTLALIAGAAGIGLVGAGAVTLRRSRRSASQS